jgi:hypothetical protein
MRILLIVISGALTVSACGGGPTAPTSALPSAQPTVTTDPTGPASPVPPPAPEPKPAPDPAPPVPPPVPSPASDTWQGTATTTDAHWYEDAPVPGEFKVKWDRETLTFGSLSAPVLAWDLKGTTLGVSARPNDMNVQIVFDTATGRGNWTLSGRPGQATGSLTAER